VAAPADESGNWARLNGLFDLASNQNICMYTLLIFMAVKGLISEKEKLRSF